MPFAVSERDGVLTLTLDTPGAPINVFNHATAQQLIGIMAEVDASRTRAIVFETAKRNSFINGVGLLLAHTAQNDEDITRASTPPWSAYRAVHDAPVPTIAVIQGNCFGCGVEFALNCDYRIAGDSHETQFYMTELNDYLFIPLFGSTWNLPFAVGFADAIDLLLWGERWSAAKAFAGGLVDEVVPYPELEQRQQVFVEGVLTGSQPSRRRGRVVWGEAEERTAAATRRRIAELPSLYQPVYNDGLDLLIAGAQQTATYEVHQKRELRCSAASALAAIGKSAYAFFYLRQMASERAAGRMRGDLPPVTLGVDPGCSAEVLSFAADVRSRKLPGVSFVQAGGARFVLSDATRVAAMPAAADGRVAVHASLSSRPVGTADLYALNYGSGGRLIELTATPAAGAEDTALLARTLQRLGFEVARTAATDTFVTNRLLVAYLGPLVCYLAEGGGVGVINSELRRAGFVRGPQPLLRSMDSQATADLLALPLRRSPLEIKPLLRLLESADQSPEDSNQGLNDALCISLLEAVLSVRERREVRDLSVVDLIARELLDFPRHHCSLCTWLVRRHVAVAIDNPRIRCLVTTTALDAASAFVAQGRELYRGSRGE